MILEQTNPPMLGAKGGLEREGCGKALPRMPDDGPSPARPFWKDE